jgi:hypothetical protein
VVHSTKWPHPINHSPIAEPRSLRLACRRFLSATSSMERVLLVTDHPSHGECWDRNLAHLRLTFLYKRPQHDAHAMG